MTTAGKRAQAARAWYAVKRGLRLAWLRAWHKDRFGTGGTSGHCFIGHMLGIHGDPPHQVCTIPT
jgi:hypothetical protein